MYVIANILLHYEGLIGYRQPFNPKYAILDVKNLKSTSGLYITDNPYVKVEYLKDSQDFAKIRDADFNIYLKRLIDSSIIDVVSQIFDNKGNSDCTKIVEDNKDKLARSIYLTAIIRAINEYISSLRSTSNEQRANSILRLLFIELNGISEGEVRTKGLKAQLLGEISSIKKEIESVQAELKGDDSPYSSITVSGL